jgi:hypothetical protein
VTEAAAAPARPLTPVGSVVMLVAALGAAGLIAISVARLFPPDDHGLAAIEVDPVPAGAAGAPELEGVAPTVTFDGTGALAAGALGEWTTVTGAWQLADGTARATDVGDDGALAVVTAPAGAVAAQVTLTVPRPGAGLVVSYQGPESYVALQVDRAGRAVHVGVVDGDRSLPDLLIQAPLEAPDQPVVLTLVREASGVEAIVNGVTLGHPILDDPVEGPWSIGLVTGASPTAAEARFDDLIVG